MLMSTTFADWTTGRQRPLCSPTNTWDIRSNMVDSRIYEVRKTKRVRARERERATHYVLIIGHRAPAFCS
ncbi:hypothetical protein KP509_22G007600 [Ceratopteris richardii]|uniref:Uncharacterized protein n=1 Tax=Ceratopteris richardii TaxID=49495 RepID=A0A8T2S4K3_CERRI|nr:hypothetical protein KP509_22G007600 [Ceratopteris richardii]